MRKVPLSQVSQINPRFVNDGNLSRATKVSFVPMASVSEKSKSIVGEEERTLGEVIKGFTYFENGDVLLAKITPCFENGKIALAKIKNEIGCGSTEFHVIRANEDKLDSKYLFHFLRQDSILFVGEKRMTGSAGQKRVPKNFIENLQIPLPPLPEQKRIAEVLDKADALREKRRLALQKLDTLLQSVFLEMFGDPMKNPKGWKIVSLVETALKFSDGPFGSNLKSSHYTEQGVRVIRLQNIGIGKLLDDDKAFISKAHYASLPKHHCKSGDVLIGTMGDPNLRACILPDSITEALNKADCILLRPNPKIAKAEYICWLLNNDSVIQSADKLSLGQTRLRISMGRLKGLQVPLPPIELQNKFSEVVKKVEGLNNEQMKSAEELDNLFQSLQQTAFKGELFGEPVV